MSNPTTRRPSMAPIKITKLAAEELMPPPSWSVSETQMSIDAAKRAKESSEIEASENAALAVPLASSLGKEGDACIQRGLKALKAGVLPLALLEFGAAKALVPHSELALFWQVFTQYQQERQAVLRAFEYKQTLEALTEKVRDHEMQMALARLYFDFAEPERAQQAARTALLSVPQED